MTRISDILDGGTEAATVSQLTELVSGEVPAEVFTTPDGRTFAIRRNDFVLDNITPKHADQIEQPKWVTASVNVQKAASLSAYVSRFKNDGTVLFADIQKSVIVGAIDYHHAPAITLSEVQEKDKPTSFTRAETPVARLGSHNVTLALQYSEEWKRWTGMNEKLVEQVDFADFLEENGYDVIDPSGAQLLELCRDIHASSGATVRKVVRNGAVKTLELQQENGATTGDGLEIPNEFTILIPIYFGEPKVTFTCLTRLNAGHGTLKLGYKLIRMEAKRQDEFQRIVDNVSVDTNTLAIYGAK